MMIIIIMKSWDDNNKSFEMLPELHITSFRCQRAAASLNVAPSCQGETHPDYGRNKSTRMYRAHTGQSHLEVKVSVETPFLKELAI